MLPVFKSKGTLFKMGSDVVTVTILRDIVTTSWSADHIGFLLLNIYLVGPTSWFCVLLFIARSGFVTWWQRWDRKTRQ